MKRQWSESEIEDLQNGQEVWEAIRTAKRPDIVEVGVTTLVGTVVPNLNNSVISTPQDNFYWNSPPMDLNKLKMFMFVGMDKGLSVLSTPGCLMLTVWL